MKRCTACGNLFPEKRPGTVCIECGDIAAKQEIEEKHKRVGVAWNKGTEMYLGSPANTRQILKTEGARKHLPIGDTERTQARTTSAFSKRPPPAKKWVFDHHEWYWNPKTLRREFRAVLRLRLIPNKE